MQERLQQLRAAPLRRGGAVLASRVYPSSLMLAAAPDPEVPGVGGFDSTDMDEWLWGLRHQVALESLITAYAGNVMGIDLIASATRISSCTFISTKSQNFVGSSTNFSAKLKKLAPKAPRKTKSFSCLYNFIY